MSQAPQVIQSSAKAGGDIVGGDKVTHNYPVPATLSVVATLLLKLEKEVEGDSKVQSMIDDLCFYQQKFATDGVVGLEAKLEKAQRTHEMYAALLKKEEFVKLLEKWSMYASAQEIFAHLLARAESTFNGQIFPQIDALSEVQTNELVLQKIVDPIVSDCGTSVFKIKHHTAMGMLYWLAEQCFVRWHK